jgi:hypothetical protein
MEKIELPNKLSNLQMELLKVFSMDLDENQLKDIRSILADYFAKKIATDVDLLFEKNNWGEDKIKEWASDHSRTPYLKK